jgi:hypothetical protein
MKYTNKTSSSVGLNFVTDKSFALCLNHKVSLTMNGSGLRGGVGIYKMVPLRLRWLLAMGRTCAGANTFSHVQCHYGFTNFTANDKNILGDFSRATINMGTSYIL